MASNRDLRTEPRCRRNHAAPAVLTSSATAPGSIFKIFTTAAALDMGMGINAQLDVPAAIPGQGSGQRRRPGLPAGNLVREERRQLPRLDERHRRAGDIAEHRLRQADLTGRACSARSTWRSSWGCGPTREPGTARAYDPESNESLADFIKRQNLGSFTLGPFEVNALELSNVAATLASGGTWCPPSPIDKVYRPRRQ